ncbi:uncharacterized protein LOC133836564 isoform X1 [Drosophila sulfurigaster albostrigata]|uniref:uncharacterized protein LOC133836564 isoform X1 n=1 Tax=Drosophila sulfurigaster albostrigata TaxID=89887 RepID=UPI002D21A4C9|nr:uncharacterized protein LOC133836564 isoform X1 [Drosophila sulfurigaster albostrigata]
MALPEHAELKDLQCFELRPLITNFSCKLSAVTVTPFDEKQFLCLVSEENEIVLRYISPSGGAQEVLKMISWFRRTNRVIHDVCFDPAGVWLLVLCFDNTLHIVPALSLVDKSHNLDTCSLYSTSQVTSYIIPFVGPHECPNSKKCPNHSTALEEQQQQQQVDELAEQLQHVGLDKEAVENMEEEPLGHELPEHMLANPQPAAAVAAPEGGAGAEQSVQHKAQPFDATGNSQVMATSFMASKTCPYPLSVVWWKTSSGLNRAIIGYSDGSICFVGLSPNCPMIASTSIQNGSVVRLTICKDSSTFDGVMLLITSSLKEQFKLLLEQKAIKYVYPGDSSPTTREGAWQIVMAVHSRHQNASGNDARQSNSSDPASDSSQLEEDVFAPPASADEVAPNTQTAPPPTAATTTAPAASVASAPCESSTCLPPTPPPAPPSYSESNAIRYQQQLTGNSFDGILPATRARLASLKSLGSKKLQAIKMRLSDQRQKIDEFMPESNAGTLAIMDSPSVTPEPLGNTQGSFYNIQNLRSTYLLSALHSNSCSLTVHSIDINLKPLFLYKIPKHCVDILISSNILYGVQYVDLHNNNDSASSTAACSLEEPVVANTEKESLDADTEKLEQIDQGTSTNKSDETSATTTSASSIDQSEMPTNAINAVSVISSAMASLHTTDDDRFNHQAQLALFRFEQETVLHLYQMAQFRNESNPVETLSKDERAKAFEIKDIHTPMDYVQFYESADVNNEFSLRQMEIMQGEFPKINYDPCYVITNKNVYAIQLKKEPFELFLDAALVSSWNQCREFCNTFDLSFEHCIEFAGDYLLRRKKITQALITYNVARVKPIRTALKLAMYGHTYALMQLSAMALKSSYLLRSRHLCHPLLKSMLSDVTYRHSEDVRSILPLSVKDEDTVVNSGISCSDYHYGVDDSISALQMSPSSQFHLANLLLITLAEKAVNDKNYLPLWNFLVSNSKYHTNMTSIVLCQSGLFSSAIILAKVRGVCLDTFNALVSVVGQEFGWYNELNVCLYNLSQNIFMETITYLPLVSMDYFTFIQDKLEHIRPCVLQRLSAQLNPFAAALRPIVSYSCSSSSNNDNNAHLFEFCKCLIETYLAVLIHMESQRVKYDSIVNALSNFRINYEDNQFAIATSRFKPISAGCAYCACVVDGVAYFWGSSGVPCCFSAQKSTEPPEPAHAVKTLELLSQLNLEVHALKCGRQHTLILTNNGLYAMGNNSLCQLGIGQHMQMALQPMLVTGLDGMNITLLEAGQYHNAAVVDGKLYMWGWGIYGQLGNGSCENIATPKLVSFFKYKKVLQVSLGHAHSLVLCQTIHNNYSEANRCDNELFVFGSNHFGQLGIGSTDQSETKTSLPLRLNLGNNCSLRLIHTKFFYKCKWRQNSLDDVTTDQFCLQLAVDEEERMYTWGSSPQALRLANQIKRRANAKQKLEENHQREMLSKRLEETLVPASNSNSALVEPTTSYAAVVNGAIPKAREETKESRENEAIASNATETIGSKLTASTEAESSTAGPTTVPVAAAPQVTEPDPTEHMTPHLVDTSEVAGQILQISSGLFHFALISSTCTLYTWGKNLEHQLGTEDKDRRAVLKPSPIDSIERPMYVDCGADFTLVMTTDHIVKAFGGNSNGQCGRDLGASLDRMRQRVVCLPTTKRLMRFESQCVEAPVEINLPRPRIRLDQEPVRYLKVIPPYQPHFLQQANINFEHRNSMATLNNYKSSTEQAGTGQDSDDLLSSLENLSHNDASYSFNAAHMANDANSSLDLDYSPEEQSYLPLPNQPTTAAGMTCNKAALLGHGMDDVSTCTPSTEDGGEGAGALQPLRHYIHYCLYAFHGLYNPDKMGECSRAQRNEYRIRICMLNFRFVEAFQLCLHSCDSGQRTLKLFEYFSKDTGYVPLHRSDLKHLIYHMCVHFLERKFDMLECERYFMGDLDYYWLELAYVFYFNNNNSALEQNLNQKFKQLIAATDSNQSTSSRNENVLQDTDAIFDSFTVKFKTILCQRLLSYCDADANNASN